MRVDILDEDVLHSLRPLDLGAYLRTEGWVRMAVVRESLAIYRKRLEGGEGEVAVPLRPEFSDYAQSVHSLLLALSEYSGVSQLSLVGRVQNVNADIIKVRVAHNSFEDGTIPLDAGAHLIERARGLMLSAAWAARSPRPILANRAPQEVEHFLRNVRLGQTERGSYIVTMKTLVPPTFVDANGQMALGPDMDEPFERQVTKALSRTLHTIKEAIAEYTVTGTVRGFESAVARGVSANLLESVEGIFEETGAQTAEVDFAWSATRPMNEPHSPSVSFGPEDRSALRQASEYIRLISPKPEYRLEGMVHKIERTSLDAPRYITVRAVVDGRARKVRVQLTPSQYDLALHAQGDWKAVQVQGELVRVNQSYELQNPTDFHVYESVEFEDDPVEAFEMAAREARPALAREASAVYDPEESKGFTK